MKTWCRCSVTCSSYTRAAWQATARVSFSLRIGARPTVRRQSQVSVMGELGVWPARLRNVYCMRIPIIDGRVRAGTERGLYYQLYVKYVYGRLHNPRGGFVSPAGSYFHILSVTSLAMGKLANTAARFRTTKPRACT